MAMCQQRRSRLPSEESGERAESGEREREKSVESSSEELDPPDRRIKGYIESTTANKEKTHSRNSRKKGGKE